MTVRRAGDELGYGLIAIPPLPGGWTPERVSYAELLVWGSMVETLDPPQPPLTVSVHPIEERWASGSTTWRTRPAMGGPTDQRPVSRDGGWLALDVTETVRRRLESPAATFGFALQPSSDGGDGIALFRGRDGEAPFPLGRGPRLRVLGPDPTITPGPSPTAAPATATRNVPRATATPAVAEPAARVLLPWLGRGG